VSLYRKGKEQIDKQSERIVQRITDDIKTLTQWTYQAIKDLTNSKTVPKHHMVLLMATAGMESGFKFRKQLGSGPARGLWQIEPATGIDIFNRWLQTKPNLKTWQGLTWACWGFHGSERGFKLTLGEIGELCENDDIFCAMIARCKYLMSSLPIPEKVTDQAIYYKQIYNTIQGKADIRHYPEIVKEFKIESLVDSLY
jgi:hypothetical protein